MSYLRNNINYSVFALLATVILSACGGSSSPSTPTTIPNTVAVAYVHNLVFRNSTTLSTGYNGFGQLGSGNLGNRSTPGSLERYYPFKGFATGGLHSVAFMNNSTVRSWGYNSSGQLGNNSTTYSSVPVKVVDLTGIKAVAAGAYHSLALNNDGNIMAWGSNSLGQLGVGSSLVPSQSPVPVKVGTDSLGGPLAQVTSIAANSYNSLALVNGIVWAWGYNSKGQLGMDPAITGVMASPAPVAGLPAGASAVAAGGAFSYAVANGEVWAWGANDNGQLGNGTTISSYTPAKVMKDKNTPLSGVVQVAAGIQHGLARLGDGTVWAWGYNFFGQLGNNGKLDSPYAVQVVKDTGGSAMIGATDIRAFGSSSMAIVGGVWYCWGNNSFGQLGIGDGTQAITVPVTMSGF